MVPSNRGAWRPMGSLAACALLAAACVGDIGEPLQLESEPDPSGGAVTGGPNTELAGPLEAAVCAAGAFQPSPARYWRLSDAQYSNAIKDLLPMVTPVEVKTPGTSDQQFQNNAELFRVSGPIAAQYQTTAEKAAADAVVNLGAVLPCDPSGEDTCAQQFIQKFAGRAFRRPLLPADVSDLMGLFHAGRVESFGAGIAMVIEAVLEAPSFLYRSEIGATKAGQRPLTAHELATSISFLLLDSIPDEPLWRAAEDGSLDDPAVVTAQVERLMTLQRVHDNLGRAMLAWLQTSAVLSAEKDASRFGGFEALKPGLFQETSRFVNDVLWNQGASLTTLLTSTKTFANAAVAQLYGVSGPTGADFVPVDVPANQRAGVLTQGSLLASLSEAGTTSIVHRGLFVRRQLLCMADIPPPAPALLQSVASKTQGFSEMQFVDFRAKTAVCSGCHSTIDPFGVVFENFDPVGRYRTSDGTNDIHAARDLTETPGLWDDALRVPVSGMVELAPRLAASPQVTGCVTQQMLGYAFGRDIGEADACTYQAIRDQFKQANLSLTELFKQVIAHPSFRARQ